MIAPFPYTLSTLLGILNAENKIFESINPSFKWITTSSTEVKKGSLFVPLVGNRDGHEFIADALSRGAIGFLCKRNHPILKTLSPQEKEKAIFVEDTLFALGKLASYHRNQFFVKVIAVTGSSGKTTTKYLLGALFSFLPKNQVVVTEKNYNNEIGVPFTLFRITKQTRIVVCEMGMNHRGEIARLSKIANPNLALITNIGSAHIENLKSPKSIAEEKIDIIEGMPERSLLFVPDDLNFLKLAIKRTKSKKIKTIVWKHKNPSELKVLTKEKFGFVLKYQNETFRWKIPGEKLLSNVRGMISIANYLKIPNSQIIKAIQKYKSPNKRLTIIKSKYIIIDDSYNANPESMSSSIDASLQIANGKNLVWVLGDMKELGKFSKFYHEEIGKEISKLKTGILIAYGPLAKHIHKMVPGSFHFLNPNEVSTFIQREIPRGTVILVKGSRSMKMEEIITGLL